MASSLADELMRSCADQILDFESISGMDRFDVTEDQPSSKAQKAAFGFAHSLSHDGGCFLPFYDPSSLSAGARSIHSPFLSPPAFLTISNTEYTYHQCEMSETLPLSTTSHRSSPSDSSGADFADLFGHQWESDNTVPPDRCCNVREALEQRTEELSNSTDANRDDSLNISLLSGLQRSFSPCHALAVNRALWSTSDTSGKPYYHSTDHHHCAQQQFAIYMEDHEEGFLGLTLDTSPVWGHERQLEVDSPICPGILSTGDSSLTSPSPCLLTSASPILALDWTCEKCGTILATKGVKNRNRNKRRHRCRGTGPECSKSYSRGDTRLLHLRKCHPECHVNPPQPRKRKTI